MQKEKEKTLEKVKVPDSGEMKWEPKGSSSEAPIVVAARKVVFAEGLAKAYKRVLEVPFSSSRKMMLTVSDVSGRAALCREAWLFLRARSSSASATAPPIASSSNVPSSSLPVAQQGK